MIAAVLLTFISVLWLRVEREPTYKGRPLSRYLDSIGSSGHLQYSRRICENPDDFGKLTLTANFKDPETLDAVSAVGTNAIGLMIRELRSNQRPLESLVNRHPLIAKTLALRLRPDVQFRRRAAVAALCHLGPRAKKAVPDLLPFLRDPVRAPEAFCALQGIRLEREDEIAALTNVFQLPASAVARTPYDWMRGIPLEWVQGATIIELLNYRSSARGAFPTLLQLAKSTNSWHQGLAALALARIRAPADQVVPVIVAHLENTAVLPIPAEDPPSAAHEAHALQVENLRLNVIALGEFGRPAAAGLPVLRRFHDENPSSGTLRASTEWAIGKIEE